ncbi:protein shisa-5-like [Betta splendens]|uniref:Protein shisa-5-like n=1 Tax=Betta splendens TaxID=158456 RepID=A0A6P7MK87_BETSP|nr:protein shisa-5-like [Betta splendens]
MASGLSAVFVLVLCVLLPTCVSADNDCKGYKSAFTGSYQASQKCYLGFCCGTCNNRYCCNTSSLKLSEDAQDDCDRNIIYCDLRPSWIFTTIFGRVMLAICMFILGLIFICCFFCPCCCLYKKLRKPRHVTNSTLPQQYQLQQVATPGQPPGYQCPSYEVTPMLPGYGAQPTGPPGPPPTYEEATCPAYPPNPMPYSHGAFIPSQTPYPLQPPAQPQFNAPPSQTDYFTEPAYNPDYVGPTQGRTMSHNVSF